ncbi:capsid protein [Clostridium sulfidigenes]|uniref:Capsid protein n=1 Tax=Clostridium sulfidigenes TaxID=318464 RepID=A0A084J9C1_9CLOT|nr:phage major capsid protein [Clostridium sulfidigenes]KEZ85555.1 capsid protein [Clostridium sulfidigenes]
MEKEKYLELRNGLYTEAEKLINEGQLEDGQAKIKEIENLDNKFENEAKALANLNALKDNTKISNIAALSNGSIAGTVIDKISEANSNDDLTNSIEYRKAFMNYVVRKEAMPKEFSNAVGPTKTSDVGVLIPETVLSKIVEKMEATGMILPLVTRTNIKGGVKVPTSSLKPVATWVAEGDTSDKQKKTVSYIDFGYFKLRCAVSNSLEVDTMALPIFEQTLINNVVEAMTKAIEKAIINGDGTNQPQGILTETVAEGQNIDVAKAEKPKLEHLEGAEAALPLAYDNGTVWLMTKKTFMAYSTIKDTNGQPVGKVNYGITGKPERILLGRTVILNDYMDNYIAAPTEDIIPIALFNMKDYVLNTNLNMTIKNYEDNDTDDQITKAIMLVDGKVIDKNSLVTITKKNV